MTLGWYYGLAAILFCIGLLGVLTRRNLIVMFMSVELMLNAVGISLATAARQWADPDGLVLVFFVIVVAAAEVVVGLAMIVNLFYRRGEVNVTAAELLKG